MFINRPKAIVRENKDRARPGPFKASGPGRTGSELKPATKLSLLGSTGGTLNMQQTAPCVQVRLQQGAWPSLSGSHERAQRPAVERSN